MAKAWKIEGQNEFDFSDCYIKNYPPLDLSKYERDRNYEFYKLQNELLLDYNKTGKTNKEILWKMYPYIEGVVESDEMFHGRVLWMMRSGYEKIQMHLYGSISDKTGDLSLGLYFFWHEVEQKYLKRTDLLC